MTVRSTLGHKALGLAFLALLLFFVWATYAIFTKKFVDYVPVTLETSNIGLQLPAVSWGLQIGSGQRLIRTAPHIIFFPSAFLSVTVLSFILLGDALRDALDPKTR